MKRRALLAVGALGFVVLCGAAYTLQARRDVPVSSVAATAVADSLRAPAGVRVRVQVINTTRIPGLARRATRVLRDHGFDVVEMSRAGPIRDSTLVLDRSFHPEWAATVTKILGTATRSESRPDSSRYLDVTVLLGTSWRPPSQALHP